MLQVAATSHVKVLIGSAGGAGINAQVDDVASMVKEIAERRHFKLNVGCIYSDVDKKVVLAKHKAGLIEPCGQGPPPLQEQDVTQSTNIVAQIGAEPFLEMLSEWKIRPLYEGIVLTKYGSGSRRRRQYQCKTQTTDHRHARLSSLHCTGHHRRKSV